jgi:hypothetical protein
MPYQRRYGDFFSYLVVVVAVVVIGIFMNEYCTCMSRMDILL